MEPTPQAAEVAVPVVRAAVVVIGVGFGGLSCAKALGAAGIDTIVIDRRNHHLFQPLLYQVATAALSPADIAEPIRKILSRHRSVRVVMAEVEGVDPLSRAVRLTDGSSIGYERLVVATGSDYGYFGRDDWRALAPGPKSLDDARLIRARLLRSFEEAETNPDPDRRRALMTSIVVGGGPTGVEMAGAIAEMTRWTLLRDFRSIDPASAEVILVEAGPRLLPAFPQNLSDYARERLERLGVTVRLSTRVEEIGPEGVTMNGTLVPAGTIVWGAGVVASAAARWLEVPADRTGRIVVDERLAVRGRDGVYALGDTAAATGADGLPLPALAQVAEQQGRHLGRELAASLAQNKEMRPFVFHDRGNTAVIGRNAAVFDFGRYQLRGWFAWVLWAIVHVYLLVGFDKRVRVTVQWLWRYVTYERGARLIL